ncbi:MAG: glycosyl hydrolase family 57 [Cyanobacteria bacterium]|nr:glycosyl hydrolase family 57 [Cyanobacteriota bacterium]MDA0864892.1 glycosyl hydrolase family 57 [Cyanobacteriota bacterium]
MVVAVPLDQIPPLIDGMPPLAGWEDTLQTVTHASEPVFLNQTNLRLQDISAAFAIALHMHQPTIPAGNNGQLINNLQHMFEHPYDGDNHNAGTFAYCYARLGDFIPELVQQGCNPRVMLDYSGTLLWGFQQMGRHDILDKLRLLTCDPAYQPHVEWLGTLWGHAVVPSTPIPDLLLHMRAWQHHFAALFGLDALARVKGFSPPEMNLPNHPDTLYAFVKALLDCGYQWLMVQEHTVEALAGGPLQQPHVPHRLVARNSHGETVEIAALIKTQGSDTKLVGQMQPYAAAKTLQPLTLGGIQVPPLVTQISDGENGGVMMNEFPSAYKLAWREMAQKQGGRAGTVGMNGTEYLELLGAAGVTLADFPACQAVGQHRLWQETGTDLTPERVTKGIASLKNSDGGFQMDGGSWTNDRSWVEGYENVMQPLQRLSARFHEMAEKLGDRKGAIYHRALLHTLLLETSCFRYWGQGSWTDYAQTLYRQGMAALSTAPDIHR